MNNKASLFSNEHLLSLLRGEDDDLLFGLADEIRKKEFGNEVYIRGILEFSNHCNKNCLYCGLRVSNRTIRRYRMTEDEILACVDLLAAEQVGTVVLQSGDDFNYSGACIGRIVDEIKKRHDIALTLSLGDRNLSDYSYWRKYGADRCLVKIETSSPTEYNRFRSGETFASRLERVKELKEMGYETGSGVIIGLPGSGVRRTLQDLMFLTELKLDMIAVGPFIPHPDTPLGDESPGGVDLSLRSSALLRILNPEANIPATSALDALSPGTRIKALGKGCNVVMPSVTPEKLRDSYFIYPGKNCSETTVPAFLDKIRQDIAKAGFTPSPSKGYSHRRKNV